MLLSQKEERSRRFMLALRAGIPIILLISVIFYAILYQKKSFQVELHYAVLSAFVTFASIYFIYFLITLSIEESLIDIPSQRFHKKAFFHYIKKKNIKTLVLIRVENLKILNEHYSPQEIDQLLYTITMQLHQKLLQYNFQNTPIGLYHPSEFILAFTQDSNTIAPIIKNILEHMNELNNIEIHFRFSIINNSENNLDKAFFQLRNTIQVRDNNTVNLQNLEHQDAQILSNIEAQILNIIDTKKLHISFRPLLNNKTNNIDIYEISVRLKKDQHEILPKVFLPIINRLGLGRKYDYLLIEHIIDVLLKIDESISLTFNLSPFSLRDKDFQTKVFAHIKEKNINPSRLIIQLYERKTHHDLSGYLETLSLFSKHGLRICIDNFGASNASMEYIKHFKFDMVQFDRDYIKKLNQPTTLTMLSSFITIAQNLGITTIAKWVDTPEQKTKLSDLGVDYLQGYGIHKYVSEAQLILANKRK